MGKGNRNNQKRAEEQLAAAELNVQKKKNTNKKKAGDRAVAIVCIVFAVIIAASLLLNILGEVGTTMRLQSAAKTENYKVDAAMMSFFYNEYLMNWYNENAQYLSYYSINPSASLRTQTYGKGYEVYFIGEYDGTWYDFFLDKVKEEVEMYLQYAEGALQLGGACALDDEDYAEIDEIVDNIKASLKANGMGFSDQYGKGVKEKDVRKCYELIFLASNFAEYKTEALEKALEADDKALHTYVEENKSKFYTAKYLSYTISITSKDYKNDTEFDNAKDIAKMEAETMAAAKTPAEFIQLVEDYRNKLDINEEGTTGKDGETLSPEEESESLMEKYEGSISFQTGDELGDWIFKENASENDVTIIEEEGTVTEKVTIKKEEDTKEETTTSKAKSGETTGAETVSQTDADDVNESTTEKVEGDKNKGNVIVHDKYSVSVYMILSPSSLDKSITKNAAYLISDDKDAMNAFVSAFKAGTMTTEAFAELAEKHYEDLAADYEAAYKTWSENHDHDAEDHDDTHADAPTMPEFSYNSDENMVVDYFNENFDKLNEWLEADGLKANTASDVIEIVVKGDASKKEEDKTYYAFIYFQDYAEEAWYASAFDLTVSDQFEKWFEDQKKATPVSYGNSVNEINTIMLGSVQ